MSKPHQGKNFLLVEHGEERKRFTLEALRREGVNLFIATSTTPDWLTDYTPAENIILTDPYNSFRLLADIVAYSEFHGISFHGVGTFTEHTVIQTADTAYACGLPGLDPRAARRSSSNKLLMKKHCREAGIAVARSRVIPRLDSNHLELALRELGTPCVIKPIFGSDSYGVIKIESSSRLDEITREITNNTRPSKGEVFKNFGGTFLLEEYIPGTMISVDGIVSAGDILIAGAVEYVMGPEPHFTQEANYIPARIGARDFEKAQSLLVDAINALGFDNTGFHCEIRLGSEGPVLIEIAARLPGGPLQLGYLKSTGIDLTREIIHVWFGGKSRFVKSRDRHVLQKAVFPRATGTIRMASGCLPCTVAANESVWDFKLFARDGEQTLTYPEIPRPLYYYALEAPTAHELQSMSQQFESSVVIELEHPQIAQETPA
ncbi:MAG TPA: ATP-grasp domain-containing protein [Thermoanaerobaculia bacterium]|nr:ATP-grasp domain-containing protein [Thermoanaerobaculia bacterium]